MSGESEAVERDLEVAVPIVGIGASAGGLKSIEGFFGKLALDTGMAYVVVQHLSPDFKSLMSDILARRTKLPIIMADDGLKIEADHIYLIPPGKELRCVGHEFALSEFPAGIHRPIDTFFNSLAMLEGIRIAGIVLSGTGSDGSDGIRSIHRVGGLTICESVESAEFDGMPRSAQRTNCIDFVLAPEDMPAVLQGNMLATIRPEPTQPSELAGIQLIHSLLSSRFKINFDEYKQKTITRRIERRQQLARSPSVFAYAEQLSRDAEELDELYHDLLIGVTKFFRDKPAFELLEKSLADSLAELPEGEMFRVWCAGCATGEEAYSLAMILLDLMEQMGRQPLLKVFATDVHQRVLNQAAAGIYSPEVMEFVSLERQKKYFEHLDTSDFRVSSTLRQHLVFARHDLMQDPPFLNIHLATCRNVLIYLNTHAQAVSLAALSFSLVNSGILFLGSSETLGDLDGGFETIDRMWRIFRRSGEGRSPVAPTTVRERRVPTPLKSLNILNPDQPERLTVRMLLDVYDAVLRKKVPLGVLLDPKQNLLHVFGEAGQFLKSVSGRVTGALRDYLDEPARTTVASAILKSRTDPETTLVVEQVQPDVGQDRWFNVSVQAVTGGAADAIGWVIEFDSTERKEAPVLHLRPETSDNMEMLESELSFTRESLSATIEELEASNEELQATNEEMIASNEELQSTNEELHSVNEELHSVNAEYQRKIEELHETTNDLESLLNSSEFGVIYLSKELCIRRFTQVATRYFDLMHHDIGRPLSNFTNRLGITDLHERMLHVVDTGGAETRLVRDEYGDMVQLKLVPFLSGSTVDGVLLTVVKQPEPESGSNQLMASGPIGLWEWPNITRDEMIWNDDSFELLGLDRQSISPAMSTWLEMLHPEDRARFNIPHSVACPIRQRGYVTVQMRCGSGNFEPICLKAVTRVEDENTVVSMSGVLWRSASTVRDFSEVWERQQHLERVLADLQDFVHAVSHDLRTPMRSLSSAVEEIRVAQSELPADARPWNLVGIHTRTMDRMLECLQRYSRVHADGNAIVPCSLQQILDEVQRDHSALVDKSGVVVQTEQLPEVRGDADQLKQVLWHLIDNAVKYSTRSPHIVIGVSRLNSRWVLSVQDNGIGISLQDQRDVFVIFRRLRELDVDGDGFGLALCKRIIERHGGRIWLESVSGAGTTVFLSLPIGV